MANQFVDDLLKIRDAWAQVNADKKAFAQQDAQMKLQQRAPHLFAAQGVSPEMSELAGLGLEAGDPTAYRTLLEQSFKKPDPTKAPIGMEQAQLLAQGLGVQDPAVLQAIQGLPQQQAQSYLGSVTSAKNARAADADRDATRGLFEQSQNRLQEKENQRQREVFMKDIKDNEKSLAEASSALGAAKAAITKGTKPSQSIVENFLLRSVAGEKGPLSDNDRAAFAAKSGFGTFQDAVNYFTGVASSNWTDDQTEAFQDLLKLAEDKQKANEVRVIGDSLARTGGLKTFQGDDFSIKELNRVAKKYGFEQKGGGWEKVVSEEKFVGPEASIQQDIEKIKDPQMKTQAQAAVAQFKGKAIPQALKDRILKAAKGQ